MLQLRLKPDGGCLSVCLRERKNRDGGGIKPIPRGLFFHVSEVLERRRRSADRAVSLVYGHTHATHRSSRLIFCIIYEMVPLSFVLQACLRAPKTSMRACLSSLVS